MQGKPTRFAIVLTALAAFIGMGVANAQNSGGYGNWDGASNSGSVYGSNEIKRVQQSYPGVVLQIRKVTLDGGNWSKTTGGSIGAILGGLAGTAATGRSSDSVKYAVGLATGIAGAAAGSRLGSYAGSETGYEIVARMEKGDQVVTLTQSDLNFAEGDRVLLVQGSGGARFIRFGEAGYVQTPPQPVVPQSYQGYGIQPRAANWQ